MGNRQMKMYPNTIQHHKSLEYQILLDTMIHRYKVSKQSVH